MIFLIIAVGILIIGFIGIIFPVWGIKYNFKYRYYYTTLDIYEKYGCNPKKIPKKYLMCFAYGINKADAQKNINGVYCLSYAKKLEDTPLKYLPDYKQHMPVIIKKEVCPIIPVSISDDDVTLFLWNSLVGLAFGVMMYLVILLVFKVLDKIGV